MKFYLMNLLVLSVFLTYKAQGIRLGKFALSATNHQDIFKISLAKESIQACQLLAMSADQFSSGINRKLIMTESTSSSNTIPISKNQKNKHDLKPEGKQYRKKDVITEQYPDDTHIADMDYTPARKKSPIHN